MIGHSLKNLGPSQKTFLLPGVPSWLRAWLICRKCSKKEILGSLWKEKALLIAEV